MKETDATYAPIGKRLVALLIDGVILSLVCWIFFDKEYSLTSPSLSMGLAPMLISWLYFALQEASSYQATIGKRVMDIHLAKSNLGQVDFMTASIRYFSKILSGLVLLIGYIMAFFSQERRTLHDIIAKTIVVIDQN